ncbi:hypothetical protein CYQ11_08675 [Streptomyces cinnamoneus]|nr:hypothetical protein CYQ11_08675 [Streptomyces cinnamoneus]
MWVEEETADLILQGEEAGSSGSASLRFATPPCGSSSPSPPTRRRRACCLPCNSGRAVLLKRLRGRRTTRRPLNQSPRRFDNAPGQFRPGG